MRKIVITVWFALIIFVVFLPIREAWAQDVERYVDNGVSISISPYWKPYSFLDQDGQPTGFLVDYWRKWSDKTGVAIEFVFAPWNETVSLVTSGDVDIHSGLYSNEERRKVLSFSQPIYRSKGVLVIKKSELRDCDDIYAEPVGAIAGSYEEFALREKKPNVVVRPFETSEGMLKTFMDGKVGAVVADLPTLVFLGGNMGIVKDIEICDTIYERDMHAGVLKGNAVLLQLVEEGMSQISPGEQEHIKNNWIVAETQRAAWLKRLVYAAFVVLLSIGGFLIWTSWRSGRHNR